MARRNSLQRDKVVKGKELPLWYHRKGGHFLQSAGLIASAKHLCVCVCLVQNPFGAGVQGKIVQDEPSNMAPDKESLQEEIDLFVGGTS